MFFGDHFAVAMDARHGETMAASGGRAGSIGLRFNFLPSPVLNPQGWESTRRPGSGYIPLKLPLSAFKL